ncbi:MAG: MATE family efflux transporter [Tissierellia bacterium]|nr:MATE family efflux transporter [Tissierellia bacterium]
MNNSRQSVSKKFYRYIYPSMLSMLLIGFYGIADGFFIGQSLGDDGLAAINLAWPLLVAITSIGTGIGTGGSIVMSIRNGAGEEVKANKAKGNILILLCATSIILTLFFMVKADEILKLLGADGIIFEYAMDYMEVITYGIIFQIVGSGITPIIKNIGKPVFAMIAMVIGMLVNIMLDAVFLLVFDMGLSGIALATCIGQATVSVLGMVMIIKTGLENKWYVLDKSTVISIIKIGCSPFGLSFAPAIVIICTNYQCLNYGGSATVAAYTVMTYASYVIYSLMQGLADGIQPLISFYKGANDNYSIKILMKKVVSTGGILSILFIAVTVASKNAFPIMYGASTEVALIASNAMLAVALSIPFIAITRIMSAYFYAIGDSRNATILVYADPLFFTPIFLLTLPRFLDVIGIWLTYPFTQIFTSLLSILLLKK